MTSINPINSINSGWLQTPDGRRVGVGDVVSTLNHLRFEILQIFPENEACAVRTPGKHTRRVVPMTFLNLEWRYRWKRKEPS